MDNRAIGVFDSGLGGLTVLREIMNKLPNENLIYFGDSGRAPYGTKSRETVTRFAFQDVRFLMKQDIKMLVIACNTASAFAYEAVSGELGIPVIEVIRPGSAAAVKGTKSGKIGVIGTPATIGSGVYENAINGLCPEAIVISKACPLFVPLVEEGKEWWDSDITLQIADRYIAPMKAGGIDTLVLGCTHYPVLSDIISRVAGADVAIISSASEVADEVIKVLVNAGIGNDGCKTPFKKYYTSDSVRKFTELGGLILQRPVLSVEKVDIESI